MATQISITESQVLTLLGNFFSLVVPAGVPVVRGLDNRVPMPAQSAFVVMTPGSASPMATVIATYSPSPGQNDPQTAALLQSTQLNVSVDCYGPGSNDIARSLSIALRSPWGCDNLPGISPLYAGDAQQMPLIDGEAQYEERWRFESALEYEPILTVAQQSMLHANIVLIEVDATYKP